MSKLYLLADDDQDDADLFGEALGEIHPPVDFRRVEDGRQVIQYLEASQNKKPDIIFLDLNMPEINGWQCLAALKNHAEYRHYPVVMYSTSSNSRDKEIAIDLGAIGLLTKPADYKLLVSILANIAGSEVTALSQVLRGL